jgi:hypothetical protein
MAGHRHRPMNIAAMEFVNKTFTLGGRTFQAGSL